MENEETARLKMTREQIEFRGIKNKAVLESVKKVPRHLFVPPVYRNLAYTDQALPSYCGQTISQPYIVAVMTELLAPQKCHKVLEIGTGTGYQTAVLAELAGEIYTMEIYPELQNFAMANIQKLGYENINFILGNGYDGYPPGAPYDLIIVTAAPLYIPEKLIDQLKPEGKMAIPAGGGFQELYLISKNINGRIIQKAIFPGAFVPMQEPDHN